MSALHEDFRAMAAAMPRRSLPSPVFKPVAVPRHEGPTYRTTCSLCGTPSDNECCRRCSDHLENHPL